MIVGAAPSLPPELAAAMGPGGATRPGEASRIAELGIPWHVARYCSFWPANPHRDSHRPVDGAVVVLRVGGDGGPPRTVEELIALRELEIGLDITVQEGFDLWALAGAIDKAPHLTIRGQGVRGWEALQRATALRSCNLIAEPPAPLELGQLRSLEYAMALSPNAAYVASSPTLTELRVDLPSWPTGLEIGQSIAKLEFFDGSGIRRLPPMRDPQSLIELTVSDRQQSFDLASLIDSTELRVIVLGHCSRVVNCEALLDLPRLERVFIGQCREMKGWPGLRGLRVPSFGLPGQTFASEAEVEDLTRAIESA
jgi:hypothetical protein